MQKRKRHFTVAREEIEWYPTINAEKCINCKVCYEFCPKDVYDLIEDKVKVVRPYQCVVLCTGCVSKCMNGAISFPKREDFEKFVIYDD